MREVMSKNCHIAYSGRCGRSGFTFAEVLAAMLFMAIVVPVTIRGVSLANRMGIMAERKRVASELASLKLNDFIVNDTWREGNQEGDFLDTGDPSLSQYRWTLEITPWTDDVMRLVVVKVFYTVQNVEYSVGLGTLAVAEETTTS